MRLISLLLIRIYWLFPKNNRRECIFRESCSQYVYRITKRYGFKKGLLALKKRRQKCRSGYYCINDKKVRLMDDSIVAISLLRESIL